MLPIVQFVDLGLIDYKKAWEEQEILFKKTIQEKIRIRNGESTIITKNYLLFGLQHRQTRAPGGILV